MAVRHWQNVNLSGPGQVEHLLKDRAFVCLIPQTGQALGFAMPYSELEKIGVKNAIQALAELPDFNQAHTVIKVLCQAQLKVDFEKGLPSSLESRVVEFGRDPHIQFLPDENRLRVSQSRKIRLLIVDDSPTIQKILRMIVESDPNLEVAGVTGKPLEVKAMIEKLKPDVMTLDIHMPDMTGVELLKALPRELMIPTIVITSLNKGEGPLVLEALENGALDYIHKPSLDQIDQVTNLIVEKIKALGEVRTGPVVKARKVLPAVKAEAGTDMRRVIAIGSSTGGTEALRVLLTSFPPEIPPVVVVQHIPAIFSAALAQRLNSLVPFEVKEAVDGDLLEKNLVLIAPGGYQMKVVEASGGQFKVKVDKSPPVNRHQPSVDVLFDSVAKTLGRGAMGVIMTGMGADGAKGLKAMRDAGARTIAQNEDSCVVFGMPKEAIRLGAAEFVEHLNSIPKKVFELLRESKKKLNRSA